MGEILLRKVNRAVCSAAEEREDHRAQGPAERFLPAGSGTTAESSCVPKCYTGLVAKHQFPKRSVPKRKITKRLV